jgi:GNAT superfamily N-acetyltransferase
MADAIPAWSTRFYRPEDDTQILALLDACFPGWPIVQTDASPLDHLRWKLSCPLDPARQNVVCELDGGIVGARLYTLRETYSGGGPLVWKIGIETMVHPDYQRRGAASAMQALADTRAGEIAAHLVFSNHPALLQIRTHQVIIPLRTVPVLRWNGRVIPTSTDGHISSWRIEPLLRFDERVDRLWAAACTEFAFLLDRRKAFMNLRYNDARAGAFTTLAALNDDILLGYAITRISQGAGHIADVLALPGRLDVVRSLVSEALRSLSARGASSVECWCAKHHPYQPVLSDIGFLRKRRSLRVALRPLGAPAEAFAAMRDARSNVHFMAGDTDLV